MENFPKINAKKDTSVEENLNTIGASTESQTMSRADTLRWQINQMKENVRKDREFGIPEEHLAALEEDIKNQEIELAQLEGDSQENRLASSEEINTQENSRLPESSTQENRLEEKELIFDTYKPEFDMGLGIPLSLSKEDWSEVKDALDYTYQRHLEENPDTEKIQEQLESLKSLLEKEFNDDFSYKLLSGEINKLEKQKKLLHKTQNTLGRFSQQSETLNKKWEDLSKEWSDYNRLLYKTTRGFLEFRVSGLERDINELKNSSD